MQLCSRCILPDTRPGIVLDEEGVCSACRGHDRKQRGIDWAARGKAFEAILAEARARATGYDCIVPVSGGKDSWHQVLVCLEHGLRVLAVTWRAPARTAIGQRNLDGLIALGVDHIDWSISPDVERRFTKAAYERKGSTAIPMHMALFAIPIRLAVQLRIPLVVWGENPQLEFGGAPEDQLATELDVEWVKRFGVTNGTGPEDWIGVNGLTAADLVPYALPDIDETSFAPRSIFLGAFEPWDSHHNAARAVERGFEAGDRSRTGVWTFADIDDDFISLHHLLKWFKFGFTRSFDNLSVDIRHGRIERDAAVEIVREQGFEVPREDVQAFCRFVGEPESWFWDVAERFRNRDLWAQRDGTWMIPDYPIDGWRW